MKFKYLLFEQPIGEFAIAVMSVKDILNISTINRRQFDQVTLTSIGGPQREVSANRINEIARYSETADATFPTPILLALPESTYELDDEYIYLKGSHFASVVDGQHRLLGLEKSKFIDDFTIPVVFILDATEEQKALIFTIINGKQTRVSASVIYDLFNVIDGRNPIKSAHEIARAINQDIESPFYRRLKMLGKKSKDSNESLTQGTFVTQVVKLISNNPYEDYNDVRAGLVVKPRPNCIFNSYFLNNEDEIILKILINVFQALKNTFTREWDSPNFSILSKTTGFTAVIKSLPELYKIGSKNKTLTMKYFQTIFNQLKINLESREITLTSDFFSPNSLGENKLKDEILNALKQIDT